MNDDAPLYVADEETQAAARGVTRLFEIMVGTPDVEDRFKRLVFACENWDHVNPQAWNPPIPSFIRHCHVRQDTENSEPVLVFDYLAKVDRWGDATVLAFFMGRDKEDGQIAFMASEQKMRVEAVPERLLTAPHEKWAEKIVELTRKAPPPTWQ